MPEWADAPPEFTESEPLLTDEERAAVYQAALERWGLTAQFAHLQEECAELIAAVSRYLRGRYGYSQVVDELADVIIMCQQFRTVFGADAVAAAIDRKTRRLQERLTDQERRHG
jgi:NTP pyrophosphatase (non-canonical NTP hydrolase)